MHPLRRTWLALMGATLLITLSVSAAFGAKLAGTDGQRGQSVAAFVHELVFGSEEPDDDEVVNEDEDEATGDDEDGSEGDEELVDEGSERQVPEEFANHGECVAEAAHDTDGFDESDAETFGEWMSMHARYVCWSLEVPGEEPNEELDEGATDQDEEDAEEASAKEQRKAERAAARAERKAEKAAARAERKAQKAEARAANGGGGHGQGKAHGNGRR